MANDGYHWHRAIHAGGNVTDDYIGPGGGIAGCVFRTEGGTDSGWCWYADGSGGFERATSRTDGKERVEKSIAAFLESIANPRRHVRHFTLTLGNYGNTYSAEHYRVETAEEFAAMKAALLAYLASELDSNGMTGGSTTFRLEGYDALIPVEGDRP